MRFQMLIFWGEISGLFAFSVCNNARSILCWVVNNAYRQCRDCRLYGAETHIYKRVVFPFRDIRWFRERLPRCSYLRNRDSRVIIWIWVRCLIIAAMRGDTRIYLTIARLMQLTKPQIGPLGSKSAKSSRIGYFTFIWYREAVGLSLWDYWSLYQLTPKLWSRLSKPV